MDTIWLLAARYDGAVLIPIEVVCRDFFRHLNQNEFMRKVNNGDIPLPIVRMDPKSAKTAKGVHLQDLAQWIDYQRNIARAETYQLTKAAYLKPSVDAPVRSPGQTDVSHKRTLTKVRLARSGGE